MNHDFVVWADTQASDAYQVEALSYEGNANDLKSPPISAGDFVLIDDEHQNQKWFGQVVEPQRNLPLQGLSRDNPSNIAAMERVLAGEVSASIFLRQVYHYKIRLLGTVDKDSARLKSIGVRPRAGARGRRADANEVIQFLDLPQLTYRDENRRGWYNNILGRIHSLDIPVPLDDWRLYHHVLVAGATGSGKSNTVANLVKAGQAYNMCVIVFDHKPDYQDVGQANDEKLLFTRFDKIELQSFGLSDFKKYSLFKREENEREDEIPIAVRASDIPLEMLAAAMFYREGEELQREVFTVLLRDYSDNMKGNPWSLTGFQNWLNALNTNELSIKFGGEPPHEKTLKPLKYKPVQRKPEWMDALDGEHSKHARGPLLGGGPRNQLSYFRPQDHISPGRVVVIRIDAEGREYGLFLSYMLKEIYKLRRSGVIRVPILNVIDEAQDIFQGSLAVRQSATSSVNEIVRKGRSKQIAFVFALQSATQLPDEILNNMNTRIIHRQNTDSELRNAIPGAPKELLQSALGFGAGEALVSILGVRSVIHADMAPSPFKLTKFAPPSVGTMADQVGLIERLPESNRESADEEDDIPF